MAAVPDTSEPLVLRETPEAGIAVLTLNRPAAMNTLSVTMMSDLADALSKIKADRDIGVVILKARGRGFSAGHDIREMQAHRNDADRGKAFYDGLFAQCTNLMARVRDLPQPVVASVQGIAVAAGCQLVATCDLAVSARSARFGVNGIDVGFFCSTPMVALSRNIGRKKAFELLTTGRLMEAEEALTAGLVNTVVDDADLDRAALDLARAINGKSKAVIGLGKPAFHSQVEMSTADAYARMTDTMVENLMLEDCAEGFAAFIDKRDPNWEDR